LTGSAAPAGLVLSVDTDDGQIDFIEETCNSQKSIKKIKCFFLL